MKKILFSLMALATAFVAEAAQGVGEETALSYFTYEYSANPQSLHVVFPNASYVLCTQSQVAIMKDGESIAVANFDRVSDTVYNEYIATSSKKLEAGEYYVNCPANLFKCYEMMDDPDETAECLPTEACTFSFTVEATPAAAGTEDDPIIVDNTDGATIQGTEAGSSYGQYVWNQLESNYEGVMMLTNNTGNTYGAILVNGVQVMSSIPAYFEYIVYRHDIITFKVMKGQYDCSDKQMVINYRPIEDGEVWNRAIALVNGSNDIKAVSTNTLKNYYKVSIPENGSANVEFAAWGTYKTATAGNAAGNNWTAVNGKTITIDNANGNAYDLYIQVASTNGQATTATVMVEGDVDPDMPVDDPISPEAVNYMTYEYKAINQTVVITFPNAANVVMTREHTVEVDRNGVFWTNAEIDRVEDETIYNQFVVKGMFDQLEEGDYSIALPEGAFTCYEMMDDMEGIASAATSLTWSVNYEEDPEVDPGYDQDETVDMVTWTVNEEGTEATLVWENAEYVVYTGKNTKDLLCAFEIVDANGTVVSTADLEPIYVDEITPVNSYKLRLGLLKGGDYSVVIPAGSFTAYEKADDEQGVEVGAFTVDFTVPVAPEDQVNYMTYEFKAVNQTVVITFPNAANVEINNSVLRAREHTVDVIAADTVYTTAEIDRVEDETIYNQFVVKGMFDLPEGDFTIALPAGAFTCYEMWDDVEGVASEAATLAWTVDYEEDPEVDPGYDQDETVDMVTWTVNEEGTEATLVWENAEYVVYTGKNTKDLMCAFEIVDVNANDSVVSTADLEPIYVDDITPVNSYKLRLGLLDAGSYSVIIPAGSFTAYEKADDEQGVAVGAFTVDFTVPETTPDFPDYITSAEFDGATLKVVFNGSEVKPAAYGSCIVLVNDEDGSTPYMCTEEGMTFVGNTVYCTGWTRLGGEDYGQDPQARAKAEEEVAKGHFKAYGWSFVLDGKDIEEDADIYATYVEEIEVPGAEPEKVNPDYIESAEFSGTVLKLVFKGTEVASTAYGSCVTLIDDENDREFYMCTEEGMTFDGNTVYCTGWTKLSSEDYGQDTQARAKAEDDEIVGHFKLYGWSFVLDGQTIEEDADVYATYVEEIVVPQPVAPVPVIDLQLAQGEDYVNEWGDSYKTVVATFNCQLAEGYEYIAYFTEGLGGMYTEGWGTSVALQNGETSATFIDRMGTLQPGVNDLACTLIVREETTGTEFVLIQDGILEVTIKGDATGIEAIAAEQATKAYDIMGRQTTAKGMVIMNGVKAIVK